MSLEARVTHLRWRLAHLIAERGSGHLGAANCVLELLVTLFDSPGPWRLRTNEDLLVLSKGHAVPALYLVLEHHNLIPPIEPSLFRRAGTVFEGHPRRGAFPGSEVTTGSLGHGCGFAFGRALARTDSQVAVVVSDGELQSGLAFETLRQAAVHRPPNFHLFVDVNGHQTSGRTSDNGGSPDDLLMALAHRFDIAKVDAHDLAQLRVRVDEVHGRGPTITMCRSVRDHGMPYGCTDELYGESLPSSITTSIAQWVVGV